MKWNKNISIITTWVYTLMTITLFNLNLIITTTAISNQFNNGLIPQFNSNTSLLTYNNSDDNIVVFNHGENGYPCIRTPAII